MFEALVTTVLWLFFWTIVGVVSNEQDNWKDGFAFGVGFMLIMTIGITLGEIAVVLLAI